MDGQITTIDYVQTQNVFPHHFLFDIFSLELCGWENLWERKERRFTKEHIANSLERSTS